MAAHDLWVEGEISDVFILISLTIFSSTLQTSGILYGAFSWNLSERTLSALLEF
jgi:hypothetical protein